jgi:NADP-dependent 3-hydroxy acid dehydrogenase YdfG
MEPDQWDSVMAINASGAYYCMLAAVPSMRSRGAGLVINISSISGVRATALGGVAYSASKFAMAALGMAASNEVNVDGVRVTNIYPGEVNTPILEKRPQAVTDEHKARMLKPADLGHLALSIATLPATAHVPEVTIKPLSQEFS